MEKKQSKLSKTRNYYKNKEPNQRNSSTIGTKTFAILTRKQEKEGLSSNGGNKLQSIHSIPRQHQVFNINRRTRIVFKLDSIVSVNAFPLLCQYFLSHRDTSCLFSLHLVDRWSKCWAYRSHAIVLFVVYTVAIMLLGEIVSLLSFKDVLHRSRGYSPGKCIPLLEGHYYIPFCKKLSSEEVNRMENGIATDASV